MVTKKYCRKLLEDLQKITRSDMPTDVKEGMQCAIELRLQYTRKSEYLEEFLKKQIFLADSLHPESYKYFCKLSAMLYNMTDKEFENIKRAKQNE